MGMEENKGIGDRMHNTRTMRKEQVMETTGEGSHTQRTAQPGGVRVRNYISRRTMVEAKRFSFMVASARLSATNSTGW